MSYGSTLVLKVQSYIYAEIKGLKNWMRVLFKVMNIKKERLMEDISYGFKLCNIYDILLYMFKI